MVQLLYKVLILASVLATQSLVHGFSLQMNNHQKAAPTMVDSMQISSRSSFLHSAAAAVLLVGTTTTTTSSAAWAKEVDPSIKGTKQDPAYQACMSTCLYECTKPKGEETKLRQECLPECKPKCATTKAQLMIGTPIAK